RLQIAGWTRTGRPNEMAEITKLGASKANGCRFMLERHGLPPEDSYAFGDTGGDVSMLRYCGIGVAMGNGTDEAKASADYVTGTVREDGLAKAFEKFGLV
ncbi:MAG: HAD hydrolase family protein, partial [Treponema sp.]|nr:HAD hydrolase family protein [Treponema sp.]